MRGWKICGLEIDPIAADAARQETGADIRVGSLHDVGYDNSSFDAVTMSNVLEHLPNPNEVVKEIFRILRPGGIFVSISPNPKSFLHRKFASHWRGLEPPRHLYLLPPRAMKILLSKASFRCIEAFSTPGEFVFMETASAGIRKKADLTSRVLRPTSRIQLITIYAMSVLGFDIGEWTVAIARKPENS